MLGLDGEGVLLPREDKDSVCAAGFLHYVFLPQVEVSMSHASVSTYFTANKTTPAIDIRRGILFGYLLQTYYGTDILSYRTPSPDFPECYVV